ncbi:NAD-dependent epimerase/dehydratase [Microthyrium microscopicum]|uniref:NAD-dependent epimerase/dehydratase n=1 Tax=Microthyrium microscopicum TaxID=703497 RepID=A0A6A6UF39_9PEZI|nr:NAD-dependent epimerase/dehydratase [Microthyrium microscopicum]
MSKTLIFGGSGKIALHITHLLSTAKPPHAVLNITRSSNHNDAITSAGGTPIIASIESSSSSDMTTLLREHNPTSVIWSAGAGGKGDPSRVERVDQQGAIDVMDACASAGVKRFIMVSAVDVRDREKGAPGWYSKEMKERSDKGWGAIGRYMAAKLAADRALVTGNGERKLEYTIVRPSALTEDKGTGKVEAGKVDFTRSISREDVARVIVEVLGNEGTVGLAFDVVGGEMAIEEAVARVVEKREDTFEGNY